MSEMDKSYNMERVFKAQYQRELARYLEVKEKQEKKKRYGEKRTPNCS